MPTTTKKKPKKAKIEANVVPQAVAQESFKLINEQDRSKLHEGRQKGMGFAFCKRIGNEIHTVMPISPCKDYLNDVLYSERTGKDYYAHGLKTKKNDIFEKDFAYLAMSICKNGASEQAMYNGYEKECQLLEENHEKIMALINWIEEKMNVSDRTKIIRIEKNLYVIVAPVFWTEATYLISLYTFMIRNALIYKAGEYLNFFKEGLKQTDEAYTIEVIYPKMEKILAGDIPKQDFSKKVQWHDYGIYSFPWPKAAA